MSSLTLRTRLRATAASTMLATALLSTPSFAQDAAAEDEEAGATIVVTGTRISAPNLESANPISVITGEEVFQTGNTSVGDQLNDLPQLRNTYNQSNSTRFLGTRGLNLLDLRGLGTQRTLVLVNGRRHVAADVLANGVSVDTNTIPSDLIERIDIVTGGASAVYGSDAIAGVVNFVLKDNYEGLGLRGQAGVAGVGDRGTQYVSLVAGKNFAEDRGNIAVNLEFSHSSPAYAKNRKSLRTNRNFVVTDTDPAGSVNGSDGVFDRTFYNDIRSATISLGGMVAIAQTLANPACGTNVSAFTCTYQFLPDGSVVPQTGTRIGIGPNGNFDGGNGYSGREGFLITLAPDLKRYSVNAIGHFEVSPAFVPFFEAKYVKTEAFGSQSGPFFSQGATLGDPGNRERIRLDNPYLSAQARATLTNAFLATNAGVNAGNNTALSASALAAQQAAINNGSFRFSLRRNWVDLGIRDEKIDRETYRILGGIRGDFNDDWKYELSVNYGEHKENNVIQGNVNIQRYLLAVDTTRDAAGNIVCRSKLDPTGTLSYLTGSPASAGDDPRLAADIAACVPLNPFGEGSVNQAAKDYILVDSKARGKITQLDIMGYVAGDTSGFFNLPGGPVAFSLGAEYRKETLFYDLDDLTQEGYAFYNAIPAFTAPSFEVKEVFGEISLPILRDVPFFQELSVRGNGRIADYKGAAGTVYAYGGEAVWKPIQDVTLRGTYARAVRAPNLTELYSTPGQNFAPGFTDPCSARNIANGSTNRATNCTAAGAPAGYDFVYSSSLEIVSGGNPNLKAETSDSWTAGILLQPRFLPGFSISADYYNITVNKAIDSVSAQNIVNLCYDSATLNNPFCGQFQRAGAGGGPVGEIPFQILESSLLQSSLNYAKLKVRGFDVNLDYVHTFDFGRLKLKALWTHVLQTDEFNDPTDPGFKNRLLDELNDPSDQVNLDAELKIGKVTFGYGLRWIDKMYLNTYEDYNSLNGLPPQNTDYAPIKKYPDVFYHDFRLEAEVNNRFEAYIGIDNAFDKMPPYGLTGVGAGSGIYDNFGRYFYAGFKAKF